MKFQRVYLFNDAYLKKKKKTQDFITVEKTLLVFFRHRYIHQKHEKPTKLNGLSSFSADEP